MSVSYNKNTPIVACLNSAYGLKKLEKLKLIFSVFAFKLSLSVPFFIHPV